MVALVGNEESPAQRMKGDSFVIVPGGQRHGATETGANNGAAWIERDCEGKDVG
ncbi:MAG TPA: hypothetical protein VFG14_17945 [Chthoniobacteraceae bacterium]|nr:hypothetical protein [Chthoniobacteraceae bacterium]